MEIKSDFVGGLVLQNQLQIRWEIRVILTVLFKDGTIFFNMGIV